MLIKFVRESADAMAPAMGRVLVGAGVIEPEARRRPNLGACVSLTLAPLLTDTTPSVTVFATRAPWLTPRHHEGRASGVAVRRKTATIVNNFHGRFCPRNCDLPRLCGYPLLNEIQQALQGAVKCRFSRDPDGWRVASLASWLVGWLLGG